MLEKVIEKNACRIAKEHGWWPIKLKINSRLGFPNRVFVASGARIKFVEFKAPDQKPKRVQMFLHDQLRNLGFEVVVIDGIEDAYSAFPRYVSQEV